jgi:hypothetical protein
MQLLHVRHSPRGSRAADSQSTLLTRRMGGCLLINGAEWVGDVVVRLRRLVLVTVGGCLRKRKKSSRFGGPSFCAREGFQKFEHPPCRHTRNRPRDNTNICTFTFLWPTFRTHAQAAHHVGCTTTKSKGRVEGMLSAIVPLPTVAKLTRHTEARGSSTRQHLGWRGPPTGVRCYTRCWKLY